MAKKAQLLRSSLSKAELDELELKACTPIRPKPENFNTNTVLPYGLSPSHVEAGMNAFIDFIGFMNEQLHTKGIERLETMLMPANYSSIVGEFMTSTIPKHCSGLVKNAYHNGHPDMIPAGMYPNDKLQHGTEGVEVKGSRYLKAWQGHNAEDAWLMVFCFESGRPSDEANDIPPMPFRFLKVVGAQLTKDDWKFSGRSATSRRTITASVTKTGYDKMMDNWIYLADDIKDL